MSKPDEIVIDFTNGGSVEAMHFDAFPLQFLGKMEVERASEIFFCPKTQQWDIEVYGADDCKLRVNGFSGYDIAREFEVKFVQRCRTLGIDPTDLASNQVLLEMGR